MERLKINKERSLRNTKNIYLFNHLIRCGDCGQKWSVGMRDVKLVNGKTNGRRYYRCNSKLFPYIKCHQRNVGEPKFDEAIWGKLLDLIKHPRVVYKEIEERLNRRYNRAEIKQNVISLESQLVSLKAKLTRLNDLYVEGQINKDVCDRRRKEFQDGISNLTHKLGALKLEMKALPTMKEFELSSKAIYNRYLGRLNELKYEQRAHIVHQLVSNIEYAFGKAKVTVLLPDCLLQDKPGMGRDYEPRRPTGISPKLDFG
jgi:hypothetical protein